MDKLKTREWLFIILIVILIQFIVQASAWLYGGNQGALGYLSFSGTAISIILAVLAIMYSFLQSASQEQSSSNIHTQVGKLVGVVENIELSKEQLTGTLEHLACVSNKLDESLTRQGLLHNEVVNLSNLFVDMNGSKNSTSYSQPFQHDFNGLSLMLVFLHYAEKLGYTMKEASDALVKPITHKIAAYDEGAHELINAYNSGSLMATTQFLAAFGYIELEKDRSFTSHPNFLSECEKFIDKCKKKKSEDSLILNVIDECERLIQEKNT
ncbi:hypothetical protein ISX50_15275 [Vibrio cyclitrophicus]|nr:hypothetical protein [Vibrio cyclitrophicus]UPR34410.1 hypothetical protein ISX50_15275 [Vibrio cyclitrophicus]